LKSYWNYISETDAFERLFGLFFLCFESFFHAREAVFYESHLAICEAKEFLLNAMNKKKSLHELEYHILLNEISLLPPREEEEEKEEKEEEKAAADD